jgi:peptidoglycan/xylan/chitin deacetylase (PgdA/CDA1 family)
LAELPLKSWAGRLARHLGLRPAAVAARLCVERNVLAVRSAVQYPKVESHGRILCYHSIGTPAWGANDVTGTAFRRHIETALRLGYRFVTAEDIARGRGRPGDLAVTFDDGLSSVAANAAPMLREFGIPWTLFVVSAWADGAHTFGPGVVLNWREIEALAARGGVIGSHSVTHRNFRSLSASEVEYELYESRRAIEANTGILVNTFAIPFGRSADWPAVAAAAASNAGYEVVYAQSERRRPPGTVPRTFITRFDRDGVFRAALRGAFDAWEEWV